MELRVANLLGNSPNFRVTIDDTLIVRGLLSINSQSYMPVPSGTTEQRPKKSPEGSLYFNTSDNKMQFYGTDEWRNLN